MEAGSAMSNSEGLQEGRKEEEFSVQKGQKDFRGRIKTSSGGI